MEREDGRVREERRALQSRPGALRHGQERQSVASRIAEQRRSLERTPHRKRRAAPQSAQQEDKRSGQSDPRSRNEDIRTRWNALAAEVRADRARGMNQQQLRAKYMERAKALLMERVAQIARDPRLRKKVEDRLRAQMRPKNGGGGAHAMPNAASDGNERIARRFENGMVQAEGGSPGTPTAAGGVWVNSEWRKARESYRPGDQIAYGLPVNPTTKAMVQRGEIDP